jgi:hypothetical protein
MENLRDTNLNPGTPDERIALLEKKMKEMEALVKGLTEELLDLKSIAMRLNKVSEQQGLNLKSGKSSLVATPGAGSGAASGNVTIRPRVPPVRTPEPRVPEPPKEEPMEMIMQPDGTLKPEKRKAGGEYVVASAGYGQKKKMGAGDAKRKDNLIVVEDDEKAAKKS